jgi:hypothetical protein
MPTEIEVSSTTKGWMRKRGIQHFAERTRLPFAPMALLSRE